MSHFTKSQVEEMARRIATLTKRDSEFDEADLDFDGTERVPVIQWIPALQDWDNRLLSLADLRNLVLDDSDDTLLGCSLNVVTDSGATVYINGAKQTSYTAHYGEIVPVVISADGYDTWYGFITMTRNATITVHLNEKGEGGSTPTVDEFVVCVTNTQGAVIKLNGSSVASGSVNRFSDGTSVSVLVEKEGYISFSKTVTDDYIIPVELHPQQSDDVSPYLNFSEIALLFDKNGGNSSAVSIESNVSWIISEVECASEEDDSDNSSTTDNTGLLDEALALNVGDTKDLSDYISELGVSYEIADGGESIASISDGVLTALSAGTTAVKVYVNDVYRGQINLKVTGSSDAVAVTGVSLTSEGYSN